MIIDSLNGFLICSFFDNKQENGVFFENEENKKDEMTCTILSWNSRNWDIIIFKMIMFFIGELIKQK